jgi:bacterial/archaeal transporter family protein
MMSTNNWVIFALGSAFFAALTAIFGKLGVSEINSNMATLIRTLVILGIATGMVTVRSEWQPLSKLSLFGAGMLVLSGAATGLSWLCYYRALQLGPASKVAPVDKLSVVLVIALSVIFLKETLTWKVVLGGCLVTAGAVMLVL